MNADRIAAFRANPAVILSLHKIIDADGLDLQQVFDHTQAVFGPVTFIGLFQAPAREFPAIITGSVFV